jgi:hypothetical protein
MVRAQQRGHIMRLSSLVATAASATVLLFASACSQGAPPSDTNAAAALAAGERFFDRETFTIRYEFTGAQTGSQTEHVRDWGVNRATVQDTAMQVMGQSIPQKGRTVIEGPLLFKIDETSGAVTQMDNPLYDALVDAMKGKSGVEFGKELMVRMGGTEVGETAEFAGHTCSYWEIMGGRTCVTEWGGVLHVKTEIAGIAFEQTAVEVKLGDGGPDAAFAVDKSKAVTVDMPDMTMDDVEAIGEQGAEMMKKLEGLKLPGQ